MAKLILNDVDSGNGPALVSAININSALTEAALEKTLSRDGTSPNQMDVLLDMNSNHIINLPAAVTNTEPVRLQEFTTIVSGGSITVPDLTTITFTAGSGLTGGGTLAANRTFNVGAGTGIAVNADDVALAQTGAFTVLANNTSGTATPTAVAKNLIRGSAVMFGSGGATTVAAGQTKFMGGGIMSATEADVWFQCPVTCTFKNFHVVCGGGAGVGQTFTYTFRKNLVDTAITCTTDNVTNVGSDTTHTSAFLPGDRVSVKVVASAGATTLANFGWSIEAEIS